DSKDIYPSILVRVDPLRENLPPTNDDDDDVGVIEGYEVWYHEELPRHLTVSAESDKEDTMVELEIL
ncbi:hypothetical protein KI387_019694, partial [Taxus chinensis]